MSNLNRLSCLVLVPAYNAADHLPELIARTRKYVCDNNLLIIDDGSTDNTAVILKAQGVNYISYPQNRGKGSALMTGFRYAVDGGFRSVLTMDADLQHLPEEIPRFYALDNGHRLLLGTRRISLNDMPLGRWLSNSMTSLIISVFSDQPIRDSQSGFRLIPIDMLMMLKLKTLRYDFESEMLLKAASLGFAVVPVPISTVYAGSRSHINPPADTVRFVRQVLRSLWY